jgi:hypothetical protein
MAELSRSRSTDLQKPAPAVTPPQVKPAASNAVKQERLRESNAGGGGGADDAGGGMATSSPGGGKGVGAAALPIPPVKEISAKTPRPVLDHILYAPSGRGRYVRLGSDFLPVEPGPVSAEQYEAAKKAVEDLEKKNGVLSTLRDTRTGQSFGQQPASEGGVGAGRSYTWGDQTTQRTSNGKGDRITIDYTREDGKNKQFDGKRGETPAEVQARFQQDQKGNSISVGRGFVNDATQREAVEITGLRPSQSGRTVITYTDLDGKSKEFAGKPGESQAELVARFKSSRESAGVKVAEPKEPEARRIWQGVATKVEVRQTTLASAEAEAKAAAQRVEFNDRNRAMGGTVTDQGSAELASAQAKAAAKVTAGGGRVHAEAGGEASAKLVAFERVWSWEPDPRQVLGETVGGRMYVYAKGFIGVEAQARLEANAAVALKAPKLDPKALLAGTGFDVDAGGSAKLGEAAKQRLSADVGANAQAFAGAKLNLGVGAEGFWHKKEASAYQRQLKNNARTVVDLLAMGNPGLGWILRQLGAETAAQKILELLFSWGAAGRTSLLALEGGVQGSAGIGASAEAKMGFAGGKLTLKLAANATWGLGLGGSVSVVFDAVEGVKFALVVMGELRPIVSQWLNDNLQAIIGRAGGMFNDVMDWFSADDKVREAVKNRAHEVVDAKKRGLMCDTLYGGWFSSDDEQAVMTILRYSKSKGELSTVLANGPSGMVGSLSRQNRAELGV